MDYQSLIKSLINDYSPMIDVETALTQLSQWQYLEETGIWENGIVPDWAQKIADELGCFTADGYIGKMALRQAVASLLRSKMNVAVLHAKMML